MEFEKSQERTDDDARLRNWSGSFGLWAKVQEHTEIIGRSPTAEDGRRVVEAREAVRRVQEELRELTTMAEGIRHRTASSHSVAAENKLKALEQEIEEKRQALSAAKELFSETRSLFKLERLLYSYLITEVVIAMLQRILVDEDSSPWSYLQLADKLTGVPGRYSDIDVSDKKEAEAIEEARTAEQELATQATRQRLKRILPKIAEHYEFFDIVKHSDGKGDTVAIRPTELLVRVYRETLVSEIDERFRPVASPESTNPQASTAAGHPCDASAEAPAAGRLR